MNNIENQFTKLNCEWIDKKKCYSFCLDTNLTRSIFFSFFGRFWAVLVGRVVIIVSAAIIFCARYFHFNKTEQMARNNYNNNSSRSSNNTNSNRNSDIRTTQKKRMKNKNCIEFDWKGKTMWIGTKILNSFHYIVMALAIYATHTHTHTHGKTERFE